MQVSVLPANLKKRKSAAASYPTVSSKYTAIAVWHFFVIPSAIVADSLSCYINLCTLALSPLTTKVVFQNVFFVQRQHLIFSFFGTRTKLSTHRMFLFVRVTQKEACLPQKLCCNRKLAAEGSLPFRHEFTSRECSFTAISKQLQELFDTISTTTTTATYFYYNHYFH